MAAGEKKEERQSGASSNVIHGSLVSFAPQVAADVIMQDGPMVRARARDGVPQSDTALDESESSDIMSIHGFN